MRRVLVVAAILTASIGCSERLRDDQPPVDRPIVPPAVLDDADLFERIRDAVDESNCTGWARLDRWDSGDRVPGYRLTHVRALCETNWADGRPRKVLRRFLVTQRGEGIETGRRFEVRVIRDASASWDAYEPADVTRAYHEYYGIGRPSSTFRLVVPLVVMATLFLLTVFLLRRPRGSRKLRPVAGRFRIRHRAERPSQSQSYWTVTPAAFSPGIEAGLREEDDPSDDGRGRDRRARATRPSPIDPANDPRLIPPEARHEGPLLRAFGRAVGVVLFLALVLASIFTLLKLAG